MEKNEHATAHGWTTRLFFRPHFIGQSRTWQHETGSFILVSGPTGPLTKCQEAEDDLDALIEDAALIVEARRLALEATDGVDITDYPEGIADLLFLLTEDTDGLG